MRTPSVSLPARRASHGVRLAWGMVAGLAALGLAGVSHAAEDRGGPVGSPMLSLEALTAQAARQQEELKRLDSELQLAQKAQAQGEREAARRASAIEQLKSEAPGVTRDLQLQELLAQAQAQAVVLSQQASELRAREAAVRGARERLLRSCDQLLLADSGKLPLAQRLGWLRLRTTQVEALHGATDREHVDQTVRTVVQAGAALYPGPEPGGGDDPQALRERADLLRDSADKLRREGLRLKTRSDELSRRQRLRERAARVDEDLFAEQTTSRHLASRGSADTAGTTLLGAPAPALPVTPNPQPTPQQSAPAGFDGSGRTTLDPSTLDVLQRAESLTDPVAKQQALQRAQSELSTLAEQLLSRAARLERRADELAHKK